MSLVRFFFSWLVALIHFFPHSELHSISLLFANFLSGITPSRWTGRICWVWYRYENKTMIRARRKWIALDLVGFAGRISRIVVKKNTMLSRKQNPQRKTNKGNSPKNTASPFLGYHWLDPYPGVSCSRPPLRPRPSYNLFWQGDKLILDCIQPLAVADRAMETSPKESPVLMINSRQLLTSLACGRRVSQTLWTPATVYTRARKLRLSRPIRSRLSLAFAKRYKRHVLRWQKSKANRSEPKQISNRSPCKKRIGENKRNKKYGKTLKKKGRKGGRILRND